jgi:hypothetical protein
MFGRQMDDDDVGGPQIGRKGFEELAQCLEAARRGPDADDRQFSGGYPRASAGGVSFIGTTFFPGGHRRPPP